MATEVSVHEVTKTNKEELGSGLLGGAPTKINSKFLKIIFRAWFFIAAKEMDALILHTLGKFSTRSSGRSSSRKGRRRVLQEG